MEDMNLFFTKCLTKLKNKENEDKVVEILEGLYSDIIIDDTPPEIRAARDLKEIGEDDINETFIYPMIADLQDQIDRLEDK